MKNSPSYIYMKTDKEAQKKDEIGVVCNLHQHAAVSKHAKLHDNQDWVCTNSQPYQNYDCKTAACKERVCTCCTCILGGWKSLPCYSKHIMSLN